MFLFVEKADVFLPKSMQTCCMIRIQGIGEDRNYYRIRKLKSDVNPLICWRRDIYCCDAIVTHVFP